MPATALIGALKNGLNVALSNLYLEAGPEFASLTDSFVNQTLPNERQNSIDALLKKERQFMKLFKAITLKRSSRRRLGAGFGGRHHFYIDVLVTNSKGKAEYQRDWYCSANAAVRSRCKGKWNSRTKQYFREGLNVW